ncbi:hypothetical protein ULG90_08145 [Halopseudomonas pachastrellae]|nr:hypothetical protein ULG90_08145 [Halopseudomonas pachastrellae]
MGLKDPAIDTLVEGLIQADSRDSLVTYTPPWTARCARCTWSYPTGTPRFIAPPTGTSSGTRATAEVRPRALHLVVDPAKDERLRSEQEQVVEPHASAADTAGDAAPEAE